MTTGGTSAGVRKRCRGGYSRACQGRSGASRTNRSTACPREARASRKRALELLLEEVSAANRTDEKLFASLVVASSDRPLTDDALMAARYEVDIAGEMFAVTPHLKFG